MRQSEDTGAHALLPVVATIVFNAGAEQRFDQRWSDRRPSIGTRGIHADEICLDLGSVRIGEVRFVSEVVRLGQLGRTAIERGLGCGADLGLIEHRQKRLLAGTFEDRFAHRQQPARFQHPHGLDESRWLKLHGNVVQRIHEHDHVSRGIIERQRLTLADAIVSSMIRLGGPGAFEPYIGDLDAKWCRAGGPKVANQPTAPATNVDDTFTKDIDRFDQHLGVARQVP